MYTLSHSHLQWNLIPIYPLLMRFEMISFQSHSLTFPQITLGGIVMYVFSRTGIHKLCLTGHMRPTENIYLVCWVFLPLPPALHSSHPGHAVHMCRMCAHPLQLSCSSQYQTMVLKLQSAKSKPIFPIQIR